MRHIASNERQDLSPSLIKPERCWNAMQSFRADVREKVVYLYRARTRLTTHRVANAAYSRDVSTLEQFFSIEH